MGISHGHPKPNFLKTETHQHAFPSENQPPSEFASVQSQESQSFGLVGSCGNYIEAGIKFFLFFCPYNIFFFFGLCWFLLLHAGFLQVWCTSFSLRGLPLWNTGSRACGLSRPRACGISSDQDPNSWPCTGRRVPNHGSHNILCFQEGLPSSAPPTPGPSPTRTALSLPVSPLGLSKRQHSLSP